MTERSLSELADAEIVPDMGGPNAYFVRFGTDDYDYVNKSARNVLVLEDDVVGDLSHFEFGGVSVEMDSDLGDLTLTRDGDTVDVPSTKEEHVLWSIHDEDGPRLNNLFDELHVPTVRQGLMDMLMPRFRRDGVDIQKRTEGWLLDGEILVGWDAENHPVTSAQTHIVSGGQAVEADEEKEARTIRFSLSDETEVHLPNGQTTDLTEVEMRFLTSVAVILGLDAGHYDDGLAQSIQGSVIEGFTDTRSGLYHRHGLKKHTLSMLGVTDEAADRLWYNDYDHAGVWEMAVREEEFRNAPIEVFEDAPNDDAAKWSNIQSTKQHAPIPKSVRSDLEERYGA